MRQKPRQNACMTRRTDVQRRESGCLTLAYWKDEIEYISEIRIHLTKEKHVRWMMYVAEEMIKLYYMRKSFPGGMRQPGAHLSAGGSILMELPSEKMFRNRVRADRIMVISDNQCNSSIWSKPV